MAAPSKSARIVELVRSGDFYEQIETCLNDPLFVNVRDYLGFEADFGKAFFGWPESVTRDVHEHVIREQIARGQFGDMPDHKFQPSSYCLPASEPQKSRRTLFMRHWDILLADHQNRNQRFALLINLWGSALRHSLPREAYALFGHQAHAVLTVLDFEQTFEFHKSARQIVEFAAVPFEGDARDLDAVLDWFARRLESAVGLTLAHSGEPFSGRALFVGNFGSDPSFLDDEGFYHVAQTRAREWQAAARSRELAREAALQEERARDAAAQQKRLAVVGAKYRDACVVDSISWPTMTPEKMAELVWQYPTSTLGVMCGVSDVAIAKFCKKHGVQKPGRGYWAKQGR